MSNFNDSKNIETNSVNSENYNNIMDGNIKEYNFIEVCSGGGGLSSGLIKSGLKPLLLNDIDKSSCKTLKLNHPDVKILEGSFEELDYKQYVNKVDLLCGGVPCQSFSYAGKQKGLSDNRGDLIVKFSELINNIKPKMFMIENVKGLMTHNNGETLKFVVNECINKDKLYDIKYKLVKALKHNVPQKRERVIIVGTLSKYNAKYNFPEESDKIVTIKEALKNVPKSEGSKYPEKKIKLFKLIPQGGCWINLPENLQKEYLGKSYESGGGKRGVLRKLSWDEPSLTILCSPAQKNTERCHPEEIRPLTIRETARIQTFDDNYKFYGSISSQYSQIGNAVPVEMARQIGVTIISCLNQL
tara:strand:- start:161 stop:1231 length:1071 start_codon:yes stop_codon:yes gene_type:complete